MVQIMIKITAPSRIHLGLIDLNGTCGRIDGGVGIALNSPNIQIIAEKSDFIEVSESSLFKERILKAINTVLPENKGIKITVIQKIPDHVGLGSGTQVTLSVAYAVNILYDLKFSVKELAIKVKRGGTSGIGIAGFEIGGIIIDGGHKFNEKLSFLPSSASNANPAPIIFRHDFPDWDIILAIPKFKGAHDKKEIDIFKKECPIPLKEVQEVSHTILMQMMPAIIDNDIENFGNAINKLQAIGFKKREIFYQNKIVKDLIEYMQDNSYGAGMSSFGPLIYAITSNKNEGKILQKEVQKILDDAIGGFSLITRANNSGAIIEKIK